MTGRSQVNWRIFGADKVDASAPVTSWTRILVPSFGGSNPPAPAIFSLAMCIRRLGNSVSASCRHAGRNRSSVTALAFPIVGPVQAACLGAIGRAWPGASAGNPNQLSRHRPGRGVGTGSIFHRRHTKFAFVTHPPPVPGKCAGPEQRRSTPYGKLFTWTRRARDVGCSRGFVTAQRAASRRSRRGRNRPPGSCCTAAGARAVMRAPWPHSVRNASAGR